MKLYKFLVFCLCVNFFTCNIEPVGEVEIFQEEEEEEEITSDDLLIEKIIFNKGTSDEYSESFSYDGNKLTRINHGGGFINVYSYDDNDNLVKDEYFESGILAAFVALKYDSDKKLTEYTETFFEVSGLDDRQYRHVYTYNDDGTITSKVFLNEDDAGFELDYTETITKANGNILKISDDEGYSINSKYDDKNGIYKNIHAIEVLNILSENEFGALLYGNTNNILTYVETDTNPDASELYNDKYEYTYNDNNYPLSSIYTSDLGTEDEDVETIDYIYK